MARWWRVARVRQGQSFKGRQFTAEVILWAVRWYLMSSISYRDLELMLADRGVEVVHTTVFCWVQEVAPGPGPGRHRRWHLRSAARPHAHEGSAWLPR
jgi:transposase-like protein